jgi:hypothetical protein
VRLTLIGANSLHGRLWCRVVRLSWEYFWHDLYRRQPLRTVCQRPKVVDVDPAARNHYAGVIDTLFTPNIVFVGSVEHTLSRRVCALVGHRPLKNRIHFFWVELRLRREHPPVDGIASLLHSREKGGSVRGAVGE